MNAIVMDISRLVEREHHSTPTGIDRYALHYANWLNERRKRSGGKPFSQCSWFIETGYRGAVPVGADRADKLISAVNRRWATTELSTSQAALLDQIFDAIDGKSAWQGVWERPAGSKAALKQLQRSARLIAGDLFDWPVAPGNASLIHVTHSRLDRTSAFSWLSHSGRKGIFYVHDLIPLLHPEYVRPHEPGRHRRRMETVLNHASLVLCNSQVTARDLYAFAQEERLRLPSIAVLPPGVEKCFLDVPQDLPRPHNPYFVIVGTIEPRKNHMLLLHLWQYLAERDGPRAPRLVIVGKRGWENSQILAMLERCRALPGLVIEVPGLEDAALARLLGAATALLSPSFVEGYGMPVAEALALHVPVIASNIPSHREAAGNGAILLDPLDGRGWRAAIDAVIASPRRIPATAGTHRWDTHFNDLEALIENDVATRHYAAQRMPRRTFAMPNNAMS